MQYGLRHKFIRCVFISKKVNMPNIIVHIFSFQSLNVLESNLLPDLNYSIFSEIIKVNEENIIINIL